jgi:anionic cell wall polymer biosynthesis LytR-Cps2A-Psr (LCP) family protein
MKTMNEDFGLNIQYYVSIDFKAFQQLVDKMGGIDIEVKDMK